LNNSERDGVQIREKFLNGVIVIIVGVFLLLMVKTKSVLEEMGCRNQDFFEFVESGRFIDVN
jgi:hypothetical protein